MLSPYRCWRRGPAVPALPDPAQRAALRRQPARNPTDRVDTEQLRAPSHRDLHMIRRFMLFFGPVAPCSTSSPSGSCSGRFTLARACFAPAGSSSLWPPRHWSSSRSAPAGCRSCRAGPAFFWNGSGSGGGRNRAAAFSARHRAGISSTTDPACRHPRRAGRDRLGPGRAGQAVVLRRTVCLTS